VKNDAANEYIEKIMGAEGLVLGSPSYFQDVTAEMKAFIDRVGFVGLANGKMYKNKVGASLACFRRSGAMHTIETMNHLFFSNDLVIAGRVLGLGKEKGEVAGDEEGMELAAVLGRRMAWIVKRLHG
jgi:multimeric flavodoxin WrbA